MTVLEIMKSASSTATQNDDSMSPAIEKDSILFLEPFKENHLALWDGGVYVFKTLNGLITRRYVIRGMGEYEL